MANRSYRAPIVVTKPKLRKYEYAHSRTRTIVEHLVKPEPLSVDDLRGAVIAGPLQPGPKCCAMEWFGPKRTWGTLVLCDVRIEGGEVQVRSRDVSHLFGWTNVEELLGGVKFYAINDAIYEQLSRHGQKLLDDARDATGVGRDRRQLRHG